MKKYQVVVLRSLKGFGQFVTESRDEANTYEFGDDDERPIIFGEKLKAVERRTIMRKVREVLGVRCWLTTAKKGGDAGISGLCMSCPACALFGGTYAPKKKGSDGGQKNAIEMRRAFYSAAFPFVGGGIRDVTFNAVDERTGQTGQALGTNQIIDPRDFIDVVTVEANDDKWVKLLIWGIEHSDRYGANTRIYGEMHNSIVGVIEDTRLRVAAIDLARLGSAQKVQQQICKEKGLTLTPLLCGDDEVDQLIRDLAQSAEVEDLAARRNRVDLSVDDYFETVAKKYGNNHLQEEFAGKDKTKAALKKWKQPDQRREALLDQLSPASVSESLCLPAQGAASDWKPSDEDRRNLARSQYGLARLIESAVSIEAEDEEDAA
jgi:CRISPR type I-D-associated protein Csc2